MHTYLNKRISIRTYGKDSHFFPSSFFATPASILTLGFHFPRNRLSWERKKPTWPEGALELSFGEKPSPQLWTPCDQFLHLSCLQGTGGHSFGQRSPLWQGTASVCWVVPQLGAFSQYQQWTHFLLSCSFTSNYVHTVAIQSVFVYSFSARLILHWLCTPIIILST